MSGTRHAPDANPSESTSEGGITLRRACIFSFYDEQGIVDDYIVFFLRELGKFVERILFYFNGPLTRDSEIALRGCVDEVILRPNVGYDVLAYKEGLQKIAFGADIYDEIIMANHTCYGPVFPFAELFDEMARRSCDFWGDTAHMAMTPNPLTGTGTLPYHLNANFIAVRRDMLRAQTFRKYWNEIRVSLSYEEAILSHEAVFTEHFTNLGYTADTYIDSAKYGTHYPAILDIDETLIDRSPLIKRRAFFHDPRFLEQYAADLPRALRVLEETSDYDRSLIWRNIVRSAELRTLNTNAALTKVLPDVRVKQDAPLPSLGRMAVCVHVYYTDMLEEILTLADTIPQPFDFIATTETAEKKAFIEQIATGRGNIQNVVVRIVEQNRGRDMSALFISCRDLFLDDTYELVCRLHTKRSPQVAAGRGNLFKRHMFENLLNSPGYTANIMDMFHDDPWIGVAVPPVIQMSYWTLGHAWFNNRERAEEVAKLLSLKMRLDADTPIAAYGTMFWFRPKALRKLFAHPWKWTDFNAEPHHVDGGLAHVLERLICYVAQDARYTTEQVLNPYLAGWNYGMLEYKLQKLAAALPNSDFSHQCDAYGRVHQTGPDGQPADVLDVTDRAVADGRGLDIDWTEVVLLGTRPDQDTVADPYNGNPGMPAGWIAEELYARFHTLPPGISLILKEGCNTAGGDRSFVPIGARTGDFANYEVVAAEHGIRLHYFYDAPDPDGRGGLLSARGALQPARSSAALIWRDEIYDLRPSWTWLHEAPVYGIPFGARNISIYIELPDDFALLPDGYRQFLRHNNDLQYQMHAREFAALALRHRPAWLLDLLSQFAPDSRLTDHLHGEMASLFRTLGVRRRWWPPGDGTPPPEGDGSIEYEVAPQILPLRDETDIRERGMENKAARFYPETHQLFVNTTYTSFAAFCGLLEQAFATLEDPEQMRRAALTVTEQMLTREVCRKLVFGLSKRGVWQGWEVDQATSMYSLTLAADDNDRLFEEARAEMNRQFGELKPKIDPRLESARNRFTSAMEELLTFRGVQDGGGPVELLMRFGQLK